MKELDIRYSELSDYEYLFKWLKEKKNNQWFVFSTKKEVELSARNWIGFSRFKASLTGVLNDKVVAIGTLYLMPYKKLFHEAMIYLIVDDDFRKRGIGSDMLKNLIHLAKNYFKLESIFAETFEGCKIISLLEKFKFNKFAVQEKYIKDDNQYKTRVMFDLWLK